MTLLEFRGKLKIYSIFRRFRATKFIFEALGKYISLIFIHSIERDTAWVKQNTNNNKVMDDTPMDLLRKGENELSVNMGKYKWPGKVSVDEEDRPKIRMFVDN